MNKILIGKRKITVLVTGLQPDFFSIIKLTHAQKQKKESYLFENIGIG